MPFYIVSLGPAPFPHGVPGVDEILKFEMPTTLSDPFIFPRTPFNIHKLASEGNQTSNARV